MTSEHDWILAKLDEIQEAGKLPKPPCVVTAEHRRLIERVERLLANAAGTDKTHFDLCDQRQREEHASIRRVP